MLLVTGWLNPSSWLQQRCRCFDSWEWGKDNASGYRLTSLWMSHQYCKHNQGVPKVPGLASLWNTPARKNILWRHWGEWPAGQRLAIAFEKTRKGYRQSDELFQGQRWGVRVERRWVFSERIVNWTSRCDSGAQGGFSERICINTTVNWTELNFSLWLRQPGSCTGGTGYIWNLDFLNLSS